jgi:fucose 4-O-acetylase-like acetyltransferase
VGELIRPDPNIRRARDPYLDNVKAILVTLVVVGHGIEALKGTIPEGLYIAIYSFHMPAFAALSGYLSRAWEPDRRRCRQLIAGLIAPFVIFQVLLAGEFSLLTGSPFPRDLLTPRGATWFLLALAWWRLATPALRFLRAPVIVAAAISVLAPLDPNMSSVAAVSRTVGFLPFFVLGLVLRPGAFSVLRRPLVRVAAGVVLAGIVAGGILGGDSVARGWLYMRSPYRPDDGTVRSLLIRLAVLAVGVLGAAAVASLAARGRTWFTVIGVNSLNVYLTHLVVLQAARWLEPTTGVLRGEAGIAKTAAVVACAAGLAWGLGSIPVVKVTRWLTHPDFLARWVVHAG